MIRHVVLLQPKPETSSEEMEEVLAQVRALQQKIDGIIEVQAGKNRNSLEAKNKGSTDGFIMHFIGPAHLQAYAAPHPDHAVVSTSIRRICSSVIDFDVEA